MENEKQDMLDRKGAWIERMFDRLFSAIQKNILATVLVISIGYNIYQSSRVDGFQDKLIELSYKQKEEMIDEVRRSVSTQLTPIREKQDSNSSKLDTSLIELNSTVRKVRDYFDKNKKK